MENKDESPLPKKKKKISTKSVEKPILVKKYDPETITSEQIKKLLKEVMIEGSYESKTRTNTEVDALVTTVEEFMRSFIIIGYDMKDEPIVITNAKSQLDADALYTSLARLFSSINYGGGI